MLKEFKSVSCVFSCTRKMSSVLLRNRQIALLKKFVFSNKFWDPSNFTRKISITMVFNNLKTIAEIESLFTDPDYRAMAKNIYGYSAVGHNLLVIQPRIRNPKNIESSETMDEAKLKLSEAIALVQTLPDWKVAEKCIIGLPSMKRKHVFGRGNLEIIKNVLRMRPDINGIFLGVDILSSLQNVNLEEQFNVQIFDRYQMVLQIFQAHARTKEAKLQIALAEIPYLNVKLCGFSYTYNTDHLSGIADTSSVGGLGDTLMQKRRRILNERKIKIKRALDKLKKQRDFLRQNERRKSYPVIAVVGYTNCGKTSLIKALTKDDKLMPENKLFATLDVTLHAGFLPSSQEVLYVDTVGFISDVPTALIEAFKSTLEDVALADVIVHVRDVSNPNSEAQKAVVLETLRSLKLPDSLMESIIEVGNKIDLVDESEVSDKEFIPISATEGINLQKLTEVIQDSILENTNQCVKILRIPNGGEEYRWLYKEATMRDAVADETDFNYLLVEVIISDVNYAKFTHIFGDLSFCLPNRT